ncbi:hypothetical protein RX328_25055 [Bradyrhizobium sp. sBnM-33]|nr:hypothetical protein [Bradyrhizobium sp. sBnM-33]WOH47454.1 hypothetical protein RX328_25055 [Bradyrhizobium sp. sBnM-33]
MPDIDFIRNEIEHMRTQVGRQRKEILQLQRAGISTAAAELLLQRMLAKIEGLCDERDRLKKEEGGPTRGACLGAGVGDARSTEMVRRQGRQFGVARCACRVAPAAARKGYCYQHVQAITVAIDQYAEKALGNRDYFLNKPHGVG